MEDHPGFQCSSSGRAEANRTMTHRPGSGRNPAGVFSPPPAKQSIATQRLPGQEGRRINPPKSVQREFAFPFGIETGVCVRLCLFIRRLLLSLQKLLCLLVNVCPCEMHVDSCANVNLTFTLFSEGAAGRARWVCVICWLARIIYAPVAPLTA